MPWQNNSGGPWGGGGGKDGGGRGPWGQGGGGGGNRGGGNQPPNLEDLIRKGQERMKQVMPGGPVGTRGVLLVGLVAVLAWLATGIYTVQPDELGIVKTFGAYSRQSSPGIGYALPWPIETVEKPQVTRQNSVAIGVRSDRSSGGEESLMLTGDENIIDVDFTVIWIIKDARDYLFNVEDVEGTIRAVAESSMREIVGRKNQQKILTEERQAIQVEVQELMQKILDGYGAGVTISEVQLQRVEPPNAVIDAFRDVQAAVADAESARNKAEGFRNQRVPAAEGEASQITQAAEAYKAQTVAEAQGEAQRFLSVYEQYRLAPEVTRERIYLETMERVLGNSNKIILDGEGAVPYLPLDQLRPKPSEPASTGGAR